jgi:ABC-type dipeptide/oligopeptide/nickel transport system permease component
MSNVNDVKMQDDKPTGFQAEIDKTKKELAKAEKSRKELIDRANHAIAKNRIAIFVIKSFCFCIFFVVAFIIYGSLFSGNQNWKEAYTPIMDILQKVFLPIVTLAFGFYNSNKSD